MIRKLLKIAVFLLIANALYQVAPVTLHYYQFRDALQELALYSQKSTDAELINRVLRLAEEHSVPVEPQDVGVRRMLGSVHIDAMYVETLQFAPGFDYPWQFDASVKAFEVDRPPGR
jgi:hypothetical protein